MYKAIIFDFGGVMHSVQNLNTKQFIADGLKVELDIIKPLLDEQIEKLGFGLISEDAFWKEIKRHINQLPPNYKSLLRDNLAITADLYPEMVELVESLKSKNLRVAVLSNTIAPHEEILRSRKAYDLFDLVVLSHNIHIRKPDIKAYEYTLNKLGVKGQEAVYIDDLEENLLPAKKLGMAIVQAINPLQVINDLNEILN